MASLLIRQAHVLDLDLPFERADVLIEDSRIVQVAASLDVQADRSLDASGKVLMPGLINAHTHSGQILERGFGDGLPLDAWIIAAVNGGPPPDPRTLYVLAVWSALTQLKSGCTASLDHASAPFDSVDEGYDALMHAYVDTGFRAAVAVSMGDLDFFRRCPAVWCPSCPCPAWTEFRYPRTRCCAAPGASSTVGRTKSTVSSRLSDRRRRSAVRTSC
jgi:cytosine/adenosine deaminase-related metal-dependent hydrolase